VRGAVALEGKGVEDEPEQKYATKRQSNQPCDTSLAHCLTFQLPIASVAQ